MGRASCPSPYAIHILVALGRILSKINTCSKHSTNVGMSLIEAFVYNGIDKGRAMKQ